MKKRQNAERKFKKNILINGWEIWIIEHFCLTKQDKKIGEHNFENVYSSFIKRNKKESMLIVVIC